MALWAPMNSAKSSALQSFEDGDWHYLAVWLGNPPQLLNARVSTSGTTLQVPISASCTDDGSSGENVRLPDYGRHDWHSPRYSAQEIQEDGRNAGVHYLPPSSETWKSTSGCSQGSDILRGVLWTAMPHLYDVWSAMEQIRVPVEQTYGITHIGMKAIAANWRGRQDHWWALITQPMLSLFQSLPILSYGVAQRAPAFMYTYSAGAVYRHDYAKLWIGQVDYFRQDSEARRLRRPLSEGGTLLLDSVTLDLVMNNMSGNRNHSNPLIPRPAHAKLDSASPFLELPRDVCFTIAQELNLPYDEQADLFYMDEVILSRLQSARPSLRFGIGFQPDETNTGGNGGPVEIELPFEALSHMHEPSYVGDHRRKRYFPMRIAEEDRGIVLGSTFFQEMELAVDYDKNEFVVYPLEGWSAGVRNFEDTATSGEWPPWVTLLLPRILLTLVVLLGILLLPSLKIAYNMGEQRNRRRKLERSWVLSHTLSIGSDELNNYANAVVRKPGQRVSAPRGRVFGVNWMSRLRTKSSQSMQVALSWLAHRWAPSEGAIRLSELDDVEDEDREPRQAGRDSRQGAIREEQEDLRSAWNKGQVVGHWLNQRLLTPAVTYTIIKPLEWTIRLASATAEMSRQLASRRQRQGDIRLD